MFAHGPPTAILKTSKFYSRLKKCGIEETLGGGYHPPGSPKVKLICIYSVCSRVPRFDNADQL